MKKTSYDKYKPMGKIDGKKSVLDYKPKTSQKYKRVEKKLDTGMTASNIEYKSDKFISKRKNEKFHRIKTQTLDQLLTQDTNFESIYQSIQDQQDKENFDDQTSIYSIASKTECINKPQVINQNVQLGQQGEDQPFLLLDIRNEDKFEEFRIRDSTNFPIYLLKQDKCLPEFYRFKNKSDKIIIIFGLDEKEGITAGNLFYDKGFDNVYLMTGGIEKFCQNFSDKIEGNIPKEVLQFNSKNQPKKVLMQRHNNDDHSINLDICKKKEFKLKQN